MPAGRTMSQIRMGFVSGSVQEWLSQPGLGLGPQPSYPKLRGAPVLPARAETLGAPVGPGSWDQHQGQGPGLGSLCPPRPPQGAPSSLWLCSTLTTWQAPVTSRLPETGGPSADPAFPPSRWGKQRLLCASGMLT